MFRLYPTFSVPRPVLSSFAEVDFTSKLLNDGIRSRLGVAATQTVVEQKMAGFVIHLQKSEMDCLSNLELEDL